VRKKVLIVFIYLASFVILVCSTTVVSHFVRFRKPIKFVNTFVNLCVNHNYEIMLPMLSEYLKEDLKLILSSKNGANSLKYQLPDSYNFKLKEITKISKNHYKASVDINSKQIFFIQFELKNGSYQITSVELKDYKALDQRDRYNFLRKIGVYIDQAFQGHNT